MQSVRSKTFVWWLLVQLCLAAVSYSQNKAASWTPQDLTDLANIEKTALSSNYGYEQLSYLTDSIGPRLTGSPQHQAAVDYVAGEMRKLGLEVTLEKAIVPHWTRGEERGELVSYPGQSKNLPQKIVLTALGHSVATPG
jgi:carboxypeptidase Q